MENGQDEGWLRVWAAIEDRYKALGWTLTKLYAETGVSEPTYRAMRSGTALATDAKRRSVTDGLGWSPNSIELILDGGEPIVVATEDRNVRITRLEKRIESIEASVKRLVALLEER